MKAEREDGMMKDWLNRNRNKYLVVIFGLLLILPAAIGQGLPIRVATTIGIYSLLAMGNMVITGYTGMLNMGMAAFYGIGAYVSALLSLNCGVPFLGCLLAAACGAGLCGFLIAFPCLRVQTDFLSLITIAFANFFQAVVLNWTSLTRGPMGLPGIPAASIAGFVFNTPTQSYYLVLAVVVLVYYSLNNILDSRFGRALRAIRDDSIAAHSMGINVNRGKVMAFTIGTFCAGLAGSLMAHYLSFIGPSNFMFEESLLIMQMCILGGLGSLPGAIVGAAFLVIMPEIFRPLAEYRLGVGGAIMILVMIFRPQGLLGSVAFAGSGGMLGRKLLERRKRRTSKVDA